jgi:hypothetical protein
VYEIIKKASRFTDDPPEVIASADSLSEAQALAHDYQVNYYGPSAYVTFRRAGGSTPTVPGSDFSIAYFDMTIEGLEDQRFVVAKLRRLSSPPVLVGSVSDPVASALGRLADIIRLGKESRNYADLKAVEWALAPAYMVSAEVEWAEYEKVACRMLEVERLEPISPTTPPNPGAELSSPDVTFHKAEMNDRPYLVAAVGGIYGSPAPVFLTWGHERESALERLKDVFRIGVCGRAFRGFVEAGRKQGMTEAEIVRNWNECEQAAIEGREAVASACVLTRSAQVMRFCCLLGINSQNRLEEGWSVAFASCHAFRFFSAGRFHNFPLAVCSYLAVGWKKP